MYDVDNSYLVHGSVYLKLTKRLRGVWLASQKKAQTLRGMEPCILTAQQHITRNLLQPLRPVNNFYIYILLRLDRKRLDFHREAVVIVFKEQYFVFNGEIVLVRNCYNFAGLHRKSNLHIHFFGGVKVG